MTYGVVALVYLVLVGVFLVLSFFNFYHLIRFGMWSRFPIVMTVLYLGAVGGLFVVTQLLLSEVDWSRAIEFSTPTLPTLPDLSPPDVKEIKGGIQNAIPPQLR